MVSEDASFDCAAALKGVMAKGKDYMEKHGTPPPIGLFICMGPTFRDKVVNAVENFDKGRLVGVQIVWQKA